MIGTSGQASTFTESVVREMARHAERPVILPLSNPTAPAEAAPADLLAWTGGKALVATGSPFAPVVFDGVRYDIGQANNALISPGLGLGAIVARARQITPAMLAAAARAVAATPGHHRPGEPLLPVVDELRPVSQRVARAVRAGRPERRRSRPPYQRRSGRSSRRQGHLDRRYRPIRAL